LNVKDKNLYLRRKEKVVAEKGAKQAKGDFRQKGNGLKALTKLYS